MTLSHLLSIGSFSAATQLSAKALRLYAEQGILHPAKIDADTGYRYYQPEQVHEARLIRVLRDLDMPIADIGKLLARPAAMKTSLKQHMDTLVQRFSRQQAAYHAAIILMRPASTPKASSVTQRRLPAMHVLTQSFEADTGTLAPRARALVAQLAIEASGNFLNTGMAFMHVSAPLSMHDEIPIELCVPTTRPADMAVSHATRDWPAQTLACIDVPIHDNAADWVAASDALFDWFDCNGASLEHAPLIFIHDQALQLAWPIS